VFHRDLYCVEACGGTEFQARKRVIEQQQALYMKAITVFKETEEQLRAELIKAVPAMVVGHRDYEQPGHPAAHIFMQLAMATGKLKTCSMVPESMTASNLPSSSEGIGWFMSCKIEAPWVSRVIEAFQRFDAEQAGEKCNQQKPPNSVWDAVSDSSRPANLCNFCISPGIAYNCVRPRVRVRLKLTPRR